MTTHMGNQAPILVVEDDRTLSDLITLVLDQLVGCTLVRARSGIEALSLFEIHHPPVIILDILLPQMNGIDFLRELRDRGWLEQTQVIITSALGYREIVQQAMKLGAKDFIVKPFDIQMLVKRVQRALEESGKLSAETPRT